jgi:hypothetical protein
MNQIIKRGHACESQLAQPNPRAVDGVAVGGWLVFSKWVMRMVEEGSPKPSDFL